LIGRIDSWDGAGEYVAQLFRKRNKIIDWEKIRNKSTENRLLKDYQEELKKLNSDLYERNRILLISFIASAILVIISVYFYVQTRKIKNELVRKNKKLEALRLSIGQIGHLAKNAVSEIYNSYFQSPTIYELDEGKKAL
jgi:cell division protein FtsL